VYYYLLGIIICMRKVGLPFVLVGGGHPNADFTRLHVPCLSRLPPNSTPTPAALFVGGPEFETIKRPEVSLAADGSPHAGRAVYIYP
jgi:hypothetical protein